MFKLNILSLRKDELSVEPVFQVRLPPPHGNCTTLPDRPLYTLTGEELKYSTMACWEACLKEPVIETCNCIPHSTVVTLR